MAGRLVEEAVRHLGHIHVLVNNVGMGSVGGPAETPSRSGGGSSTRISRGCSSPARRCFRTWSARAPGRIVNISSIAAIRFAPDPMVAYYASKGG